MSLTFAPKSAPKPASAPSPSIYKKPRKESGPSVPIDNLLAQLVSEAIGIGNVPQWYAEALEINQLFQSMSPAQKKRE